MSRRSTLLPALAVALSLAGCHLTASKVADLGPGRGRVDRTVGHGLGPTIRAVLESLDEQGVHPRDLVIRSNNAASNLGKPGWDSQSNVEYFPEDQSFHDLFERQLLTVQGAEPVSFPPVQVTYQGEAAPSQAVAVIVRSLPPDASRTEIMTRVGRTGNEALSRKILDGAVRHLDLLPKPEGLPASTPALAPQPTDTPALPPLPS